MKTIAIIISLITLFTSSNLFAMSFDEQLDSAVQVYNRSITAVEVQIQPIYGEAVTNNNLYSAVLLKQGLEGFISTLILNRDQLLLVMEKLDGSGVPDEDLLLDRCLEVVGNYDSSIKEMSEMLEVVNAIIAESAEI